ncbi:hypothetical protein [Limnochorda pilosa]|uniref:Uncharacterized protein n=1 Tax=Limnochorda pilosa TaxID=1555112 RepID=A0A0K2SLX5_LIMPI|nr:hypothetical protein [Limnochorda pilosa]BAS28118.1 hypothetical protein LIP_2277 [Limnochorda pilosa]
MSELERKNSRRPAERHGQVDRLLLLDLDCADPRLVFDRWLDDFPYIQRLVADYRTEEKGRLLERIREMTVRRFRVARHLLRTRPWDFFMMVEIGTDRTSGSLWAMTSGSTGAPSTASRVRRASLRP